MQTRSDQSRSQAAQQIRPPPNQQAPAAASTASYDNVDENIGFFSAKAVNQLPESSFQAQGSGHVMGPQGQQMFNPKLESPSIRKTPGIDHTSSKPVSKGGQHVPPSSSQAQTSNTSSFTPVRPSPGPRGGNVINPALDQARRIGAPGGLGSPLSNRGSFRQPTMKRPPPSEANNAAGSRPALVDIPANAGGTNVTVADGVDAKRQKTT